MILKNENGITIKELKEYVKDLPEEDEYGEDYTVWIGTKEGFSNPCYEIRPLGSNDIILQ